MKNKLLFNILAIVLTLTSCNYLDLVPDNIPTMDMAFTTRQNAEKMLASCYNYMPEHANIYQNPGLEAGDEVWKSAEKTYYHSNTTSFNIAKGNQNANDPYLNYWSGGQDGKNLFIGMRDCNILIENVHLVPDMNQSEKRRWIAEVKVLKAFYHYWLLQLYGPIPFIDKNLDVSASAEEMKLFREPVDIVVDKIVALIDEATADESLPLYIRVTGTEMGRLTRPAALAIKAKVLLLAASPLFNGNPDFPEFKNKEGVELINTTYDPSKWMKAKDACKEAIDLAHEAGHQLYEFDEMQMDAISDTTLLELTLRNTITSRFNKELIWGLGNNASENLMRISNVALTSYQQGKEIRWTLGAHAPTMDVVEQFYSKNGVPIDEDKQYDYTNRYKVEAAPVDHEYYIEKGAKTANLNYNREPRFYAYLGFDRGKWYNLEAKDDKNALVVRNKAGETGGRALECFSITGYFAKKLVNYKLVMTNSSHTGSQCSYPFPIIRLSDLYLMYAEALNETKDMPNNEVYEYVQKVRNKAGLDKETGGLVQTWSVYSKNTSKPTTKNGMRDIIQRERMIELAFEGHRFFDLRRWRLCMDYFNRPIRGWNISGETDESYYQINYIFFKKFTPKDYFWPIKLKDIYVNRNLIQNPHWEN